MKRIIITYFLFLLFLFTFLCSGVVDSQDGLQYLAVARSLYYTGEPTAPSYEYLEGKNIHMSTFVGINGKTYSPTGLGFSAAMIPSVAITDAIYKIYNGIPPVHFPLENDWAILLFASFTNAFWGSLLGVVLFLYFTKLNLNKKHSLFLSFIAITATNLFVYTKHIMAHMMFVTLMMIVFYLIKNYSLEKKSIKMFFVGVFFGLFAITYNSTFMLSVIPLALYYLLVTKFNLSKNNLIALFKNTSIALLGVLPFIFIYFWYERLRIQPNVNLASANYFAAYANSTILHTPISVLIEGIYGQLFSPGRSIFIYSPVLLILILFWHKIPKKVLPELIVTIVISVIYIYFYSTIYSIGKPDQGIASYWHGESSWGPRYLTPLIPLAMLTIGSIYTKLKIKEKIFVFFPLVFVGLYIEMLGILIPYQTKFHDMQRTFTVNSTQYSYFTYTNLLPRYTPIFTMTKNLVKLIRLFPKTLYHGEYNVRFYDGVNFPFNVGTERWRTIPDVGYILFDNKQTDSVNTISIGVINHQLTDTKSDAVLTFFVNGKLIDKPQELKITERRVITLKIQNINLKKTNNVLAIKLNYKQNKIKGNNKQLLGIINFSINNHPVNMESLDYPYVYNFAKNMVGVNYYYWGNKDTDPWEYWEIHTQIFERTPDFWWVEPLYYWDLPKKFFLILFLFNLSGLSYFGFRMIQSIKFLNIVSLPNSPLVMQEG